MLVHNKTRKRELVDVLFEKGLSVSYNRVLQVSTDIANKAIDTFESDGVVVPTTLRTNLYTTGNLDNIDYNPSSRSAKGAFHGTAISLTQHTSHDNFGNSREIHIEDTPTDGERQKQIKQLPETYVTVPPVALPQNNPVPPETSKSAAPTRILTDSDESQSDWLSEMKDLLHKDDLDNTDTISWSAYFAGRQETVRRPPAITALLPLFRDNAHYLAMVRHWMDLIKQAFQHISPRQVPVLTVDNRYMPLPKRYSGHGRIYMVRTSML